MPDETRIHWTDDEDLLARFVLGQLDAAEASSLEKHLAECSRCSDAVRTERVIAAGLKRAGREEFKKRLAGHVAQRHSYEFNWYQAAGIAAAIMLLVTLGIHYNWFFGEGEKQIELRQKPDSDMLSHQEAPAPQAAPKRSSTGAEKQGVSGKEPKSVAGAEADGKKKGVDELRILSLQEAKRIGPVPTVLGKGIAAESERAQPMQISAAARTQELWARGTVVQMAVMNRFSDKAADVAVDARGLPAVAKTAIIGVNPAEMSITQSPASALPRGQQRATRADEVQTLFRKVPRGLQMVLFGDTLLTPQELAQARLEQVGVDSVLLVAGRKLIGYKVPQGWLRQQAK